MRQVRVSDYRSNISTSTDPFVMKICVESTRIIPQLMSPRSSCAVDFWPFSIEFWSSADSVQQDSPTSISINFPPIPTRMHAFSSYDKLPLLLLFFHSQSLIMYKGDHLFLMYISRNIPCFRVCPSFPPTYRPSSSSWSLTISQKSTFQYNIS